MAKVQKISLTEVNFPSTAPVEAALIGATAANRWMMSEISGMVTDDMFSEKYRSVWQTLREMADRGEDISMDAIIRHIPDRSTASMILGKMVENPSPQDTRRAAEELRRMTLRHRLYDNAVSIIQAVATRDSSEDDLLAMANGFEERAVEGLVPRKDRTLSEAFQALAESLEAFQETGKSARITSGWTTLDRKLQGGFAPGQLVILAARPSVGKTAFMLQMAMAAARSGEPAMIYSLEMTEQELAERYMVSAGGLTPKMLETGQVDWQMYDRAVASMEKARLCIDDRTRDLQGIVSSLTMRVQHGGVRIAFIDYLAYIQTNDGNIPLYQKLGNITATLKATARKLEIPIVLLCQLNRETAKGNRAPELYDLRDSGSIEQDADTVLMLQRFDHGEDEPSEVAMHIRKNRRGKNNISLGFRANDTYTQFSEVGEVAFLLDNGDLGNN